MNNQMTKPKSSFKKFPKDFKYDNKLSSYQGFYLNYFTRTIVFYKGSIDIDKYFESVDKALHCHYLILGNLRKDKNGDTYIYYDPNNPKHTEKEYYEIEYVNASMETKEINVLKYHSSKLNFLDEFGFVKEWPEGEDLPNAFEKITIFNDGFVISKARSHAFNDLLSECEYGKLITDNYNSNDNKYVSIKQIKINYYNQNEFIDDAYLSKFDPNTIDDYFYTKMGYINKTKINEFMEKNPNDIHFLNNSIIKLKFDLNQLSKLQAKCTQFKITKNDIIHAVLLKVFTFTNYLKDHDTFTLKYAFDTRKLVGLDEKSIGCALFMKKFLLGVEEIRKSTIENLSIKSNQDIKYINQDDYFEFISVIDILNKQGKNISNYISLPSFYSTNVTNWNSYNYKTLNLNNRLIHNQQSWDLCAYGLNTITFEYENNIKYYIVNISIPTDCIDKAKDLSNHSKLFTVEKIKINNSKL